MGKAVNLALQGGVVRLTMPAKTAGDLGALQKGLKSLAERLGHPNCATGCDILHLGMEREFTLTGIGEEVALNPQPLPPVALSSSDPMPFLRSDPMPARAVTVAISDKVSRDINALTQVTARVLGKLGCGQCCSGFDILFRREMELMTVDEKLNVQGFGRFS